MTDSTGPKNYFHVGIAYQEHSLRLYANRASFASLPGELRNLAYSSALKFPKPVTFSYCDITEHFYITGSKRHDRRTELECLELLSNIDHNIRAEARSYFFANNTLTIKTRQSLTTDPDYIEKYINFLENIGEIGRRSLRWLRLTVDGDTKLHRPTMDKALKFWALIADCTNLSTLDIYADIDYFYMNQHAGLRMYMCTEGYPISHPWPVPLESIQALKNLKRLVVRTVYSSRWRFFQVAVNLRTAEVLRQMKPSVELKTMHISVHRPRDEATGLSEQLKGFLRRGLRGSTGVRMMLLETWDVYGADVQLVKDKPGDEWKMHDAGRRKPLERRFHNSNGFTPRTPMSE